MLLWPQLKIWCRYLYTIMYILRSCTHDFFFVVSYPFNIPQSLSHILCDVCEWLFTADNSNIISSFRPNSWTRHVEYPEQKMFIRSPVHVYASSCMGSSQGNVECHPVLSLPTGKRQKLPLLKTTIRWRKKLSQIQYLKLHLIHCL